MAYTLAQAAEACGINRSTVLRALKAGKISGQRDASGVWHVEAVELHRIFPPAEAKAEALPQHAQPDAELRIRLALADERLGELKGALADMRSERDHWREQAQASQRQLADQRQPEPEPMSWWRWMRSTG